MTAIDPKVHAFAASLVDDVLVDGITLRPEQRTTLVDRLAGAIQEAVEDECAELREELLDGTRACPDGDTCARPACVGDDICIDLFTEEA